MGLSLGGCGFETSPLNNGTADVKQDIPAIINPADNPGYVDTLTSNFAKASFLTVLSAVNTLQAVKDAGVDFDQAAVRSVTGGIDINDLGPYITARTSTARSAAGGSDGLEVELEAITAEYEAAIAALVPSPDAAVNAGLLFVKDGQIIISDDQSVPLNSLDGIATVEVMNRVAAGEAPEQVVAEIQAEIEKLIVQQDSRAARGLYIKPENAAGIGGTVSGARWNNGLIRYHFESSMTAAAKQNALTAMGEWTTKTNNKVRFQELSPSVWDTICRGIGQTQYLNIGIYNLDANTAGSSTVGSFAVSRVKISPTSVNNMRTYRHELGHTIGLIHEHQRPDRDNYVVVSNSDTTNYGRIPEKTVVAGLYPVKILFITIYLPYIWYVDYGKTVGSFDFGSVMLYGDLEKKSGGQTIWNLEISDTDAATVRQMY
ncbi:hypothetical protein FACS189473_5130 [Spirochaetia bacterium]|nr:hypothetical protein FACS189473_5130 [Spirochaetia bacterium]